MSRNINGLLSHLCRGTCPNTPPPIFRAFVTPIHIIFIIFTTTLQKGCTKTMQAMNKRMNLPQIQKIMMEFEKQSEIMDMKEEMMSDAVDDVIGDEEDDEESDAVVNQVLDELGLGLSDQLSALPSASGAMPAGAVKEGGGSGKVAVAADEDADLQARLENLRK